MSAWGSFRLRRYSPFTDGSEHSTRGRGKPATPMIPHSRPTLAPQDIAAVTAVLESGWLAQGEATVAFEAMLASQVGGVGAVATSSGTAALHLALLALNVGPGDEVMLPSYVCTALLNAVRFVGATPILVDIEEEDYNLSPADVRRKLTRRTRVLLVPHTFGLAADLKQLSELGVPIVEDCAQALGATLDGQPAGGLADLAVFSFYATKVITTGEGGMVVTRSTALRDRIADLRDYADKEDDRVRYNYKMTDMQAALGLSQLKRLPTFVSRRRELAARYSRILSATKLILPCDLPGRPHIFYRYVVRMDQDVEACRERLAHRDVRAERPIFKPLHEYLGLRGGFPNTERAARISLSIPLYPSLSDEESDRVVQAVLEECDGRRAAAT